MQKTRLTFWISALAIALILLTPHPAHAYLVPVIGGLAWLIAIVLGFVVAGATFIWLHMIKLKEKRKKSSPPDTDKPDSDENRET